MATAVDFTLFLHPRRSHANLCLALKLNVIAHVADTPLQQLSRPPFTSFSLIASMLLFSFSCPSGIVERATTFLKRGSKHLLMLCVLLVVGSSSSAPTWPWQVCWRPGACVGSIKACGCVGTEQNYPQSRRFASCVSLVQISAIIRLMSHCYDHNSHWYTFLCCFAPWSAFNPINTQMLY